MLQPLFTAAGNVRVKRHFASILGSVERRNDGRAYEVSGEPQGARRRATQQLIGEPTREGGEFQTLLAAAAHNGDGPSRVSAKRKAETLGVHPEHFTAARQRIGSHTHDPLQPAAMDESA